MKASSALTDATAQAVRTHVLKIKPSQVVVVFICYHSFILTYLLFIVFVLYNNDNANNNNNTNTT